jgi:hypothetical protein
MKKVTGYQSERTGKTFVTAAEAREDENKLPRKKIRELKKRIASKVYWRPEVGDIIYVPTSLYIDRGEDDVEGGLALVTLVREEGPHPNGGRYLRLDVAQHPNKGYYWNSLFAKQADHMKRYKNQVAYPDPDTGVWFNTYGI